MIRLQPAAKMKSLKIMMQLLMALILLTFAGWLFWKACIYLKSLARPSKEIVIVPFEGGADKQKVSAQAILSSKFRSLRNRSKDAPAGYGLFSLPLLDSNLLQTQEPTNAIGVLDEIEFKIKDVNLGTLVKAFNSMLAPAHYELQGTVSELPGSVFVTCKLTFQDHVIASWESEVKGSLTDLLLIKAIDEIVYQMIYDFMNKEELERFKIKKLDKLSLKNWQGLQNYVNGLSALRAYQMNLDTNDLKIAFESFDKLALIEPDEPLGLYFRGLIRSEKRQEALAVSDFAKLQRLLQRKYGQISKETNSPALLIDASLAGGSKVKDEVTGLKKMLLESKLNEATSQLKIYKMEFAKAAIETLLSVITAIHKDIDPKGDLRSAKLEVVKVAVNDQVNKTQAINRLNGVRKNMIATDSYLTKLLALCEAQLGYTHGTILSFRRDEGAKAPNEVSQHHADMNLALAEAQSWFEAIDDAKAWNNERERRDVHFRISNARGYGRFRYAYYLLSDLRDYDAECDSAVELLGAARASRPDHYEVLQNLGMIYADSNYDREGRFLSAAQELFELTKQYVPDDYYQYEQLAKIHWRRATTLTDKTKKRNEIDAGRAEANLALDKRAPDISDSAMHTLTHLALAEWNLTEPKDALATIVIQAFRNAESSCLDNQQFLDEYVAFLRELSQLRSPDKLKEVVTIALRLARNPKTKRPQSLKPLAEEFLVTAQQFKEAANALGNTEPTKPSRLKEAEDLVKTVQELNSTIAP